MWELPLLLLLLSSPLQSIPHLSNSVKWRSSHKHCQSVRRQLLSNQCLSVSTSQLLGPDTGAWKSKLLSLGSWNFAPFPALFLPPALVTPPQEALICGNISLAQPLTGAQNQQSLGPGTISCFRMTKGKWGARWWGG